MGQQLASMLNNRIDNMVTEDRSRADIIRSMASAAGIDDDTVRNILAADIDCPPVNRLNGFARALDVSAASVRSAAESDGCSYGDEGASANDQPTQTWYGGQKAKI